MVFNYNQTSKYFIFLSNLLCNLSLTKIMNLNLNFLNIVSFIDLLINFKYSSYFIAYQLLYNNFKLVVLIHVTI